MERRGILPSLFYYHVKKLNEIRNPGGRIAVERFCRCVERMLYITGLLLVLTEIIMQYSGKSLCTSSGCRTAELFVSNSMVLLAAGAAVFLCLTLASFFRKLAFIRFLILTSALSVEGYLVAFQSFIIREFCLFCMVVFAIFVFSVLVNILQKKPEYIISLAGFLSVLSAVYLVNPGVNEIPRERYVLIYSKDCPHCEETIRFCRERNIPVSMIDARKVVGTLKSLGLDVVPVLVCNSNRNEREIFAGSEKIKEYLISLYTPSEPEGIDFSGGMCTIFSGCGEGE